MQLILLRECHSVIKEAMDMHERTGELVVPGTHTYLGCNIVVNPACLLLLREEG